MATAQLHAATGLPAQARRERLGKSSRTAGRLPQRESPKRLQHLYSRRRPVSVSAVSVGPSSQFVRENGLIKLLWAAQTRLFVGLKILRCVMCVPDVCSGNYVCSRVYALTGRAGCHHFYELLPGQRSGSHCTGDSRAACQPGCRASRAAHGRGENFAARGSLL